MLSARIGFSKAPLIAATDPDALAYIAGVEAADGQTLEPAVSSALGTFIVGLKVDGWYGAITNACILCGARTLAGALIPLKGGAPTNNNFVSGDYNRKTGLLGNAATKSLQVTGVPTSLTFSQSACLTASPSMIANNTQRIIAGSGISTDSGATHLAQVRGSSGQYQVIGRSRTGALTYTMPSSAWAAGLWASIRPPNSSFGGSLGIYANSVATYTVPRGSTPASGTPVSTAAVFASYPMAGGSPVSYSDARVAWFHFGDTPTQTQAIGSYFLSLNSRLNTLLAALAAAIP